MKHLLLVASIVLAFVAFAQNASNTLYWKNRPPYAGYWQQDVAYKIDATIDETTDIITGHEQLTYTNHSPDTLQFVFFHLYQNAFQPGSYLHDLQVHNGEKPRYGKYEAQKLGTTVDSITNAEGVPLVTNLDNTILKVWLTKPLLPNSSTVFNLRFRTYYDNGSTRRRMKKYKSYGFTHYNGCQWYPKICVYDRKSGWNTDQHLNREFYGDYGSFDVSLNFASNYIVEATGELQNEPDVLPDTLKEKLHLRKFKDKKWDEKPSEIIPYNKEERKTWRFHADNVHDFAFTADPTYRIADTTLFFQRISPTQAVCLHTRPSPESLATGNIHRVRCVAICPEPHAAGWQNAADYCAKIIRCFSEDIGLYEYPKMVVADAADGMEYPMLTLDAGRDPDYRGLLVHEIGHNWFYGMLGNNETYRAMLDEGFTQFLTAWGLEHIDGKYPVIDSIKNKYVRHFYEPPLVRDTRVYNSYLYDATLYKDEPLNTHSDMFNGALGQGGGYRHVYSKTATMLYNLQYVLGDSLFLAAFKNYVAQWKMAHPYPEDFRNSITHFTHADLNWFFDQWMETTKNIDYKVARVHKTKHKDEYAIKLTRKGRMQMPIDLQVISKKDSAYNFYVPNTWFVKKLPVAVYPLSNTPREDAPAIQLPSDHQPNPNNELSNDPVHPAISKSLLPKWYGWDKLQPSYTAIVKIPGGVKNVIIDPSGRLADINNFNNRWRGNVEWRFDSRIYPAMSWRKYRMWLRPDVWYNSYDGFKLGANLRGNYMGVKHVFSLSVWISTRLAQGGFYTIDEAYKNKLSWVSYNFNLQTSLNKIFKNTNFYFQSRWLDGLELYKTGIVKQLPQNFWLDINLKAFTRNKIHWNNYLVHRNEWSTYFDGARKFNTSLNLSAGYQYAADKTRGNIMFTWRSGTLFNSSNYHYLEATHINRVNFWRFDLRTRLYGRYGTGSDLPDESALFFAAANPEEMMENKYMRAAGFAPQHWSGYGTATNHLHYGGGLNMRGYAGYLLPEIDRHGVLVPAYKGHSGLAVNTELDFNRLVRVRSAKWRSMFTLNTYLFADAGALAYTNSRNEQQWAQLRADAGMGIALTIKKWWVLQDIKPLTIRFDMPLFLSHTPYEENQNWKFRWVIGINRAF